MELLDFLKNLLRFKIASGFAPYLSAVIAAICVAILGSAAYFGDRYIFAASIPCVCIFAYFTIRLLLDFAGKHTEAAILDGIQLGRLLTARERAKGKPEREVNITDVAEEKPAVIPQGVDLDIPDADVKSLPSPRNSGPNDG